MITSILHHFRTVAAVHAAGYVVLATASLPVRAAAADSDPNILLIVADDLGWSDLGCYGNAIHRTPHLDRLASEGRRFTQAYAPAPICSASRAAIQTGRSPARLGFEFVVKDRDAVVPHDHALLPPPYPLELPLAEVTLGEAIGRAGYATGFYGKWHLAQHYQTYLGWEPTHGPLQQGYAEGKMDFGSHPYGDKTRPPDEQGALPPGDYGRDELTENAIGFLRAHQRDRFFLQVCHYYVHEPVRSRAAWLVDECAARLPAGAPHQRAVYAAMVQTLDHLVGELLAALDDLGLAENTLVVFTSDNGGNPIYAANAPLRGGKWSVYEGGIRVPWIVRWPGHVPAGTTSEALLIGTDLMPTLCAATGAPLPPVPLDGVNLLPVWQGQAPGDRDAALVWHFPYYHPEKDWAAALPKPGINDFALSQNRPQSAIRVGDWALVHFYEGNADELYHLTDDVSQQHTVLAENAAKARELRSRLDAFLASVGARRPEANPHRASDAVSRPRKRGRGNH